MKISTALLNQTQKLTNVELPNLDPDEWVKIKAMRNAIGDINSQIKASSNVADLPDVPESEMAHGTKLDSAEDDPDVQAVEDQIQDKAASDLVIDEGLRWSYVWDYMCEDFYLFDIDPESGSRGRKLDPKSQKDKDMVFLLHGSNIVNVFLGMGGGLPTKAVKAPDGTKAGFPDADKVGDTATVSGS